MRNFLGLIVLILCACSNPNSSFVLSGDDAVPIPGIQKETNKQLSHELVEAETITIPIDYSTPSYSEDLSIYADKETGTEYLIFLNQNKNYIHFFSLDSFQQDRTIEIAREGPNKIDEIGSLEVINRDSIIMNIKSGHLAIIDWSGNVIDQQNYLQLDAGGYIYPMWENTMTGGHLIFDGGVVYQIRQLYNGISNPSSFSLCIGIDLKNKKTALLPLSYPTNYNGQFLTELSFTRNRSSGEFLYSFVGDHNLYSTYDHKSAKSYGGQSKYFDDFAEVSNENVMKHVEDVCASPSYSQIIYDSYRKLVYRIAYPGLKLEKDDNPMTLATHLKQFSIIVFDENYKKIGETMLPTNTFLHHNYFVSSKGLYISRNHPNNPDLDENKLVFTRFELKEL